MIMKTTASVWCLAFTAVVLATTVFSKQNSGSEESSTEWKRSPWLSSVFPWRSALPPPFFAGNKRPAGLPDIAGGSEIQQKLPGDPPGKPPYFVSLFDPSTNTPIYSAYKVTPDQAKKLGTFSRKDIPKVNGRDPWRDPPGSPGVDGAYTEAITKDRQQLSRGHMNPSGINTFKTDFMEATFTLTNAVPQFQASNSGPWQEFETQIRDYARDICGPKGGTLYLLTGRSENGLSIDRLKGLVVHAFPKPYSRYNFGTVKLTTPRAVWTAGCCVWGEPGKVFGRLWPAQKAESFAVMSNNLPNKGDLHQTQMSVLDLERLLMDPSKKQAVNLFPGNENCRQPAHHKML